MKTFALVAIASLTLSASAIAQTEDDAMARDLAVVQKPLTTLRPATRWPLSVSAAFDRPDRTYAIGEKVRISVRPNKTAYITVINVGTSGRVTVLFPNTLSRDNLVRAGQTLTLPARAAAWSVQAQGPGGVEVIKVFASTSPTSIYGSIQGSDAGPFRSLDSDGEEVTRDLAVTLNAPTNVQWAETTRLIRVVPFR